MIYFLDLPTELHEQILLHLPERSLLLARAICRTLEEAIRSSVHIQQALWIRPTSSKRMIWSPHASREGRPVWDTGNWVQHGEQRGSPDKGHHGSAWLIANPFIPA